MSDQGRGGRSGGGRRRPYRGRIEERELTTEMRSSYLDYAMSVIVGRALPDVRDGLKPVHRRVLYAMHDLGLQPNRPYRKSAFIVGEVMGKYHPHGDSAIYDTLARMAQQFSLRYLLVDGQGNFGSIDDDPPAAMRYTEARLARLSTEMLRDIDADTVEWGPNYDESQQEPLVLPARFPEPARQRLVRDRGRDGDQHPAAQPERVDRRGQGLHRQPRHRPRRPDGARQGPRLPRRRNHERRRHRATPTPPAAPRSGSAPAPTSSRSRAAATRSSSPSCRSWSRRAATAA